MAAYEDELETIPAEESQRDRATKRKTARKCTDQEVELLIDTFEQQFCVWDVCNKEYHLKEKRIETFSLLQETLPGISLTEIKSKITSLRAQFSRHACIEHGFTKILRVVGYRLVTLFNDNILGDPTMLRLVAWRNIILV